MIADYTVLADYDRYHDYPEELESQCGFCAHFSQTTEDWGTCKKLVAGFNQVSPNDTCHLSEDLEPHEQGAYGDDF
jgi:hypothetical protein